VETVEHESQHLANLASHRHCAERIQAGWCDFLSKRDERLQQQQRLGEACEKVAENILEDLFTNVLDWPLVDFNNQVEHADIVLTDHGIKRLVVEVKRPGSLAWNRRAVESALAQVMRYADEQKIKAVALFEERYNLPTLALNLAVALSEETVTPLRRLCVWEQLG
jgi:hypothetical protein